MTERKFPEAAPLLEAIAATLQGEKLRLPEGESQDYKAGLIAHVALGDAITIHGIPPAASKITLTVSFSPRLFEEIKKLVEEHIQQGSRGFAP